MAKLSTSGTQAATLGTTHTLKTITAVGTYQLMVDSNTLVEGETLRLQAKTRILDAGADRIVQEAVYAHSQGTNMKVSLPVFSDRSISFTLLQTGSTGVSFPWKIIQLDAST